MRYIDTTALVISPDWVDIARVSHFSPLWSSLKPVFESIVGKKCWYNESINDGTSNPIDHFRPKTSKVKKLNAKYATLDAVIWSQLFLGPQPGYPFLELEYSNYRYACGFSNSAHTKESKDGITRGKWDFFPLKSDSILATNIQVLGQEMNALLDPCNSQDPELLTFNEFGGIDPSDSILTNSWEYCRVKISIEVYNLMYFVISSKRQELWITCERDFEMLSLLYNKSEKTNEEQLSFDHLFKKLIILLEKKSEYSAVVIDCIKHYRKRKDPSFYKWLHEVIPDELLKK